MLQIKDCEFMDLVHYIKENFGINLESKRQLVEGRLGNHVRNAGFSSFSEYFDHVCRDASGRELSVLVGRLTTNHTCFFRETMHFDFLSSVILPALESRLPDREVRIWSAGCSTGEEPYSIAIALQNHFGAAKAAWDTRILATDISAPALEKARSGQYPASALDGFPPAITRHFRRNAADTVQVSDPIRKDVVFRSLNLVEELFPLRRKFHVIFCRNVMIYFDQPTKNRLVDQFYDLTEPGGYLLIGHAETVNRDASGWQYIRPATYRKPDREA